MKAIALLALVALTATAADVRLGWNVSPDSPLPDGFNLYMATGQTNPVTFQQFTTNTTATVTNLAAGIYKFYVTATNSFGESLPSNTVLASNGKPFPVLVVTVQVFP